MNSSPTKTHSALLVYSLILAIVCGALIYSQFKNYSLRATLGSTQTILASTTLSYQIAIQDLRNKVTTGENENKYLTGILNTEQRKRLDLEKEKVIKEKQIDTLTKLTTIDPELLKKYSKIYFLSENYTPEKLVEVPEKFITDNAKNTQILSRISPFVTDMLENAAKAGVPLRVLSAYRSFASQQALKSEYRVIYGAGTANQFSADQGYSEHQMGTAIDFTTPTLKAADLDFEDTSSFTWLTANAYKYGFILSYPKSNSYYVYEPWHWRFVGRDLATYLHDSQKKFYELDQREIDTYLIKIFD